MSQFDVKPSLGFFNFVLYLTTATRISKLPPFNNALLAIEKERGFMVENNSNKMCMVNLEVDLWKSCRTWIKKIHEQFSKVLNFKYLN